MNKGLATARSILLGIGLLFVAHVAYSQSGGTGDTAILNAILTAISNGVSPAGTASSTGLVGIQGHPSGIPVSTKLGTYTGVRLRATQVTTGGTAVTAFNAGDVTYGGFIVNPKGAAADLCINQFITASGTTTLDALICIPAGTQMELMPSALAVSVVSSDGPHPFGGQGAN